MSKKRSRKGTNHNTECVIIFGSHYYQGIGNKRSTISLPSNSKIKAQPVKNNQLVVTGPDVLLTTNISDAKVFKRRKDALPILNHLSRKWKSKYMYISEIKPQGKN